MATTAYRTLTLVEPASEQAELPPYELKKCRACETDFRHPNGRGNLDAVNERFCMGGRHGFLWLRRCQEARPHIHQRCKYCGAEYLLAPAKASPFVRR